MNIPKSGRILVIDDQIDEALPLIKVLSQKGIPTIYYTGEKDLLPESPLMGIRIVFLDIEIGIGGQSDKTKVATAINILNHLIAKQNGPYLIIAWTKHEHLITEITRKINKNQPILSLNLEKSSCLYRDNGNMNCNFEMLEENLQNELNKSNAFQILAIWDNLIHDSVGEIISDLSSLCASNNYWNRDICKILLALSMAQLGDHLNIDDNNEIIQNALMTNNYGLIDNFERRLFLYDFNSMNTSIKSVLDLQTATTVDKLIDKNVKGKLNSMLLLSKSQEGTGPQPGNVYLNLYRKFPLKINDVFDGELSNHPKRFKLRRNIKKIILEVSPTCDFANKKWKKHRFILGFLWPFDNSQKIKKAEYVFTSPLIEFEKKQYVLTFDFRQFISTPFNEFKSNKTEYYLYHEKKPLFLIRYPLLVDIQSHLARHINRPGVVNL